MLANRLFVARILTLPADALNVAAVIVWIRDEELMRNTLNATPAKFATVLVAVAFLAACGDEVAPEKLVTLPLQPCRVAHMESEVRCATLPVFENRETRQGRKIGINIVVLPATARIKEPDPVFLLAGGPGQAAADLAREAMAILGGLNGKRDIVLIDQRGTGKSNGLGCKLGDSFDPEMADPVKRDQIGKRRLMECRDELAKRADLTQYTTTIAMADLDAVRAALGYDRINLWGGSYGTRAAIEYLRRYPENVRSMVLDGVAPPSLAMPATFARDAGAAYEKMLGACASNAECVKHFPGLRLQVDDLLTGLAKAPRKARIVDPLNGVERELTISRDMLLMGLFSTLYVPEMAAQLPLSLVRAKQGDFGPLMAQAALFGDFAEEKIFMGMRLSVVCAEDLPRVGSGNLPAPPFGRLFIDEFAKGCEVWPKGKMGNDFDQPVKSDKPVLILSGGLDPVTPPALGDEVARSFTNAAHFVAPNIGHGVSIRGCAPKLIKKFIEGASVAGLDGKCLERLPRPMYYAPMRARAADNQAKESAGPMAKDGDKK